MNDHTRRILERAQSFIHEYLEGNLDPNRLVLNLEGSINAIEEDIPEDFYEEWYSFWGELEGSVALMKAEPTIKINLTNSVNSILSFFERTLENSE